MSGRKLVLKPMKFGSISITLPKVAEVGIFDYNWIVFFCKKGFFSNNPFNFIIQPFEFIGSPENGNNVEINVIDWFCKYKLIIFVGINEITITTS